jgi:hypothetical protein
LTHAIIDHDQDAETAAITPLAQFFLGAVIGGIAAIFIFS